MKTYTEEQMSLVLEHTKRQGHIIKGLYDDLSDERKIRDTLRKELAEANKKLDVATNAAWAT